MPGEVGDFGEMAFWCEIGAELLGFGVKCPFVQTHRCMYKLRSCLRNQ